MRRRPIAALLGLLALGAAGCGGSSPVKSSSVRSSTQITFTATSTTTTGSGSTSAATTVPPPTPAGTPAAPDGLRPTAGYATYEMCSSGCSGAVSGALRRPLSLPSPAAGSACVSHQISGPVKPLGSAQVRLESFVGSAWKGARVTWTADSSYEGPVLIRGRQLGGGAVGFGEGHVPYDELQLDAPGQGAATPRGTGREWFTFTRAERGGCYFYQVDGTNFSETILFRAVG